MGLSGSANEPTCRRWRVASMESILGGMQFEKVHTIRDFYDGIRSGTADLSGAPHYFASLFDDKIDDYTQHFRLCSERSVHGTRAPALGDLPDLGG